MCCNIDAFVIFVIFVVVETMINIGKQVLNEKGGDTQKARCPVVFTVYF